LPRPERQPMPIERQMLRMMPASSFKPPQESK
jgi:hypothetical protein